jgi:hypothetical protein
VQAGHVVDTVEAKARGVTRLTRTTGVMARLPKKGKKCNLCIRYEVFTHVSGPGRSLSLQVTLVHRPLEPELGVALVTSVAAPGSRSEKRKSP